MISTFQQFPMLYRLAPALVTGIRGISSDKWGTTLETAEMMINLLAILKLT
jgi:hypothetical protein